MLNLNENQEGLIRRENDLKSELSEINLKLITDKTNLVLNILRLEKEKELKKIQLRLENLLIKKSQFGFNKSTYNEVIKVTEKELKKEKIKEKTQEFTL